MSKILFVHSSARGSASASRQLAEHFKAAVISTGAIVSEIDLAAHKPQPLDEATLGAFFTPEAEQSAEQVQLVKTSEQYIEGLLAADTLVISAGMYNFSLPSTLKAYIDQILRAGRTFRYTENGPEGLVKGKKAVLILTMGGVYSQAPMSSLDFLTPYLKSVLGFMGITDVEVVVAEGLAMGPENAATAIENAKQQLAELTA